MSLPGSSQHANRSVAMSAVIISPEDGLRRLLRSVLAPLGFSVRAFEDPRRALDALEHSRADIVISESHMPQMGGLEVLQRAKEMKLGCDVILITESGELEFGVSALRQGATDFFEKPCQAADVHAAIERTRRYRTPARQQQILVGRVQALSNELNVRSGDDSVMVGASQAMRKVAQDIVDYSDSSATVLVLGESGTGKEVIAKAVHTSSPRRDKPFLTLNCSAIAENLFESEMFGHRRGAFTGAVDSQTGYVRAAEGGSLFLDEIGDLPLGSQAKILRLLEQKSYLPVGENQERKADVRMIAATNQPLPELVRQGKFREDLYYRLSVCTVHVPPLRERQEDIPLLAIYFTLRLAAEMGRQIEDISEEALARLSAYGYPGNVRELKNIIESSVIRMHDKSVMSLDDLPDLILADPGQQATLDFSAWPDAAIAHESIERSLYSEALKRCDGNVSRAARLLGLERSKFRRRLARLELP